MLVVVQLLVIRSLLILVLQLLVLGVLQLIFGGDVLFKIEDFFGRLNADGVDVCEELLRGWGVVVGSSLEKCLVVGGGVEEGGEGASAEAGGGSVGGRVEAGQRHLAARRLLLAGAQRLVTALQQEFCTQRPP